MEWRDPIDQSPPPRSSSSARAAAASSEARISRDSRPLSKRRSLSMASISFYGVAPHRRARAARLGGAARAGPAPAAAGVQLGAGGPGGQQLGQVTGVRAGRSYGVGVVLAAGGHRDRLP